MSIHYKGLPQNNIRYRNSKKPEVSQKTKKLHDAVKKLSVVEEMQQMKQRRETRKKRIEEEKQHKKDLINDPNYIPKLDYDFDYLIHQKKLEIENESPSPHTTSEGSKIYVCVRKRPIFDKEIQNGEIDCVSAINPKVIIYDCKLKIDGYTKYIDTNDFYFDNVFNENEKTDLLFDCSVKPSLDILLKGGVVTCFAYGQTGSGKTFTMKGIEQSAIETIFEDFENLKKTKKMNKNFKFFISFFEIYSGRLYDLLNNRNKVMALEDKNQKVQIYGLTEKEVFSPKEMSEVVEFANTIRTTHNTVTNETSSRSHAICNFVIKVEGKKENEEYAKLSLVDLAGSERATETQSNDKSRLAEGAEINKSLLALKECIRALDAKKNKGETHVPFRNSKLTLVLRDSFLGKANLCKIIMISCISPSNHSSNHTINTLRYSDRLKEKTNQHHNACNNNNIILNNSNNYNIKKSFVATNMQNNNNIIIHNHNNSGNIKFSVIKNEGVTNTRHKTNNHNKDNKDTENNHNKSKSHKKANKPNFSQNMNNKRVVNKKNNKDNKMNNLNSNNFGALLMKKENIRYKNKDKKINNENKSNNYKEDLNEQKINNFFDDIEDLNEDNMQKLNLKPTPIYQPNRRITFDKRKKYALQKKTNTERVNNENDEENNIYLINNNTYLQNENEGKNNLLISSGSVDSKIKKNKHNIYNDKLINSMKKSFERNNNILDIDFDDIGREKKNGGNNREKKIKYEDYNTVGYNKINNDNNNDTQKIDEDDYLEPDQEEIKIEINKDNKLINNYNTNNIHSSKKKEKKDEKEDDIIIDDINNENNKTDEISTVTNTKNLENLQQEQEHIITNHIGIIKNEAQLLSEEGNLISKIKGVSEENYSMEEYMPKLEEIINLKLNYFKELKQRIQEYKSSQKSNPV